MVKVRPRKAVEGAYPLQERRPASRTCFHSSAASCSRRQTASSATATTQRATLPVPAFRLMHLQGHREDQQRAHDCRLAHHLEVLFLWRSCSCSCSCSCSRPSTGVLTSDCRSAHQLLYTAPGPRRPLSAAPHHFRPIISCCSNPADEGKKTCRGAVLFIARLRPDLQGILSLCAESTCRLSFCSSPPDLPLIVFVQASAGSCCRVQRHSPRGD